MWYNGFSNQKTGEYDYTKGLKADAQNLIGNTKWRVGGWSTPSINTGNMYNKERGTSLPSTTTSYVWTGKVGLIYPTDYSFAMNPSTISRSSCLGANYWDFKETAYSDCKTSSYIFASTWQWTITPKTTRTNLSYSINTNGTADGTTTYGVNYGGGDVRPTVYLKSNVLISSGDGSEENPYTLQG